MTTQLNNLLNIKLFMNAQIEIYPSLNRKPRPHYLIGTASLRKEDEVYTLETKALFSTTSPSVEDRNKGELPHVNIADAYFGVWNAIHILSDRLGWKNTLALKGSFHAREIIPANTEVGLIVKVQNIREKKGLLFGDFDARYFLKGKTLLELSGRGRAQAVPNYSQDI